MSEYLYIRKTILVLSLYGEILPWFVFQRLLKSMTLIHLCSKIMSGPLNLIKLDFSILVVHGVNIFLFEFVLYAGNVLYFYIYTFIKKI